MTKNTNFLRSIRFLLLGVFLLPILYSQSSAQYCTASTGVQDEYICEFSLGDISNTDCKFVSSIGDYTNMSTTIKMGDSYTATVKNAIAYSGDQVSLWIDWNINGTFDTSTEQYNLTTSDGAKTFTGTIVVPTNATTGSTRLRVRMIYTGTISPCGSSTYGEVEDYTVNLVPPIADAQVTALTSPVKPFLVGNYPVTATLKSNNDVALTSCQIDWWVNNVLQGTVNWNGNMKSGATTNLGVGSYNFVYPIDEVNFNPFRITFTVKNVNGKTSDADPSNDTYSVNISPSLNDCGAIGFFGPPEGFGAGTTQVRARVMNYAPKPLSRVTVNWKIDGTLQTPKTFTGLNIKQNEYLDLDMGTFYFYNKTPLGPFAVELWTELPNNVADENSSNDMYKGGIGPSLSAGIYTAGGTNAHFASPAEAASYLNSSGVFGLGTVVIEVRSGVYNGQIILNNPLANNNPVIFRSATGKAYDVTLTNSPSTANNFVMQLANINNLTFENLTIQNNNNNISNAGRIVTADNMSGLTFSSMVFNGVNLSPKTAAYNLITANNCTNLTLNASEFNNGSASFWSNTNTSPKITITNNFFNNFSWYGVYNSIATQGTNTDDFTVAGNTFKRNNSVNPSGAIFSFNASSITKNTIADITGTGNANEALIKVAHTSPNQNNTAWIEDNVINNCSNINGIQVSNANTVVNKNIVVMSQSSNFGCALLDFSNCTGAAGNNMLMGSNMLGLDVDNSPALYIVYNTGSVEFNGNPVARVTGASANIMRNILVNKGNGVSIQAASGLNIDQNIIFSQGTVLANINGVNYADMTAIKSAGLMLSSSAVNVEFFSPSDPHLKVYSAALLFNDPLFTSANSNGMYIESKDFDGEARKSYYAGIDEINLSIAIERQTEGFTDCIGSTTNYLTVSSAIGYNAPMTYQWELDGAAISGATEPILYFKNLRHSQAGVYKCLVKGPGKTDPVYSRPVAVFVARPTDITVEPTAKKTQVGGTVALTFSAHVNGKNIESAIANDEVKVQWFKYVDEANDLPLVDNNWISGSKSNYLTFRNFRLSDQGEYYATIDGLCGLVKTAKVSVSEEVIDLTVVDAPKAQSLCAGKNATISVNATTSSNNQISYQWSKDGALLQDVTGKISGTTTNTLTVNNLVAADKGNYSVLVKLLGTTLSENPAADLKVVISPVITTQPTDVTVQSGKIMTLDLVAEGSDANEVLVYKWYKDGQWVSTSNESAYTADPATVDDAGDYYVEVSNDCGTVKSNTVKVSVTTGTTSVVEVSKNGYSLTTALPNPVSGSSLITFAVPTESFVKVTLTDASGASRVVLTEGNFGEGTHTINIDANKLNLVSGTYFYFLESNGVRLAQKMVVIK
jgi:hypothetical protein